nr:MAG TPA: hypothetical protein [Caudoviricetes sp.]
MHSDNAMRAKVYYKSSLIYPHFYSFLMSFYVV